MAIESPDCICCDGCCNTSGVFRCFNDCNAVNDDFDESIDDSAIFVCCCISDPSCCTGTGTGTGTGMDGGVITADADVDGTNGVSGAAYGVYCVCGNGRADDTGDCNAVNV